MNRLWEQNKPLVFVMGACVALLVIIRPTVFSMKPPLARWMGKAWKRQHDGFEAKGDTLAERLDEFYPERDGGPAGETISSIETRVGLNNRRLKQNFDHYVQALAFIPYRPFVAPMDKPERDWGPHFRKVLDETREALLQYCSFRFVKVAEDLGFGEFDRAGVVPPGRDVPNLLRDLAAVETLVRLCADSQVAETKIVQRRRRQDAECGTRPFMWEYPMRVKLHSGYRELMKLLEGLTGQHGLVKDVEINELRDVVEKVTLNIGQAHGVRRDDRFTLFKKSPDKPSDLTYAGRVTVTSVLETESVARVDEDSLPYDRFDAARKKQFRIRRGDHATSGFFRVSRVDIKAAPGSVQSVDKDGIPTKVIPHMLDVEMDLSTIGFDLETEYVTVKNVKGARRRPTRTPRIRTTGSGIPRPPVARRSF